MYGIFTYIRLNFMLNVGIYIYIYIIPYMDPMGIGKLPFEQLHTHPYNESWILCINFSLVACVQVHASMIIEKQKIKAHVYRII